MNRIKTATMALMLSALSTAAIAGTFNTGDTFSLVDASGTGTGWIDNPGDNLTLTINENGTVSLKSDLYDITYTDVTGAGTDNLIAQAGSGVNLETGDTVMAKSKNDLYTLSLTMPTTGEDIRVKTWLSEGDVTAFGTFAGNTASGGGGSVPVPASIFLILAGLAGMGAAAARRKKA